FRLVLAGHVGYVALHRTGRVAPRFLRIGQELGGRIDVLPVRLVLGLGVGLLSILRVFLAREFAVRATIRGLGIVFGLSPLVGLVGLLRGLPSALLGSLGGLVVRLRRFGFLRVRLRVGFFLRGRFLHRVGDGVPKIGNLRRRAATCGRRRARAGVECR